MSEAPGFIPPHGHYQELLSYQKAEVVYDLTFRFCKKFLTKGDRTVDQWFRLLAPESKILSRAAKLPEHPKKWKSN